MRSLREILVPADVAIEGATGLALILVPDFVTRILLGSELPEIGAVVARVAGIALVAMVIGAWLGRHARGGISTLATATKPMVGLLNSSQNIIHLAVRK